MIIEPRTLKGFRDSSPAIQKIRNKIWQVARQVAQQSGFEEIATPALEYAEILIGQAGGETEKQTYLFKDHGDREVGLRFDLTIPFARYVSENYGKLVFPLRRLQIGDVWRGENTQKGRFREFCQCDFDIVGSDTEASDIEVVANLARVLSELKFGAVTISINSRPVLTGILQNFFADKFTAEKEARALIALDKLGKISSEQVATMLQQIFEVPSQGLVDLLCLGDLSKIANLLDQKSAEELRRLTNTNDVLNKFFKFENITYKLNFTIARGLGYYDGIVFETTIDALPKFGSICSGGRYNNLIGRFSKESMPGVGGSIGVDRLVAYLEDLPVTTEKPSFKILVAYTHESVFTYACEILSALRKNATACELGLQVKIAHQFRHADRLKIPFVITVGPDEMLQKSLSLKNMLDKSEQKNIALTDLLTITKSLELIACE